MISTHKPSVVLALGFSSFVLLILIPAVLQAAPGEKPFSVRWQQERLSITADGAPLAGVLQEVARQTGIEVRGIETIRRDAHVRLSDLPLGQGLSRLLANVNYALLEGAIGSHGEEHLVVVVLGESSQRTVRAPASDQPLSKQVSLNPDENAIKEADKLNQAAESGDLSALRRAAAGGDSSAQAVALQLLSRSDPKHAKALAIAAATSRDLDRRLSGLQVLGDIDGPDATAALGAALKDPALSVRQAALMGLLGQTQPNTVGLLVEATKDRDPSIRIQALEFLSQRGAEGEAALTLALSSPETEVRSRARELLDQMNAAQ